MSNGTVGANWERKYKKKMEAEDWSVARVAGSGKGFFCDLIAIKGGVIKFVEVKHLSNKNSWYWTEDTDELVEKANEVGGKPILAVRPNYSDWKVFNLNEKQPKRVWRDGVTYK